VVSKKLDNTGNIQALSVGQKVVMGWRFLDRWYFAGTVDKCGDKEMIGQYVRNQSKEYNKPHSNHQLALF
jgi:hypothetical protein